MLERFLRFPGGKTKALTFSYDDGVTQDKRLVTIFKEHGLKGTFHINAGLIGRTENNRLSESEVLETYANDACEIACHSYRHPYLTDCDRAVAYGEIINDRLALEKLFGREVHGMSYPYGPTNDVVAALCRSAGIYYSRTTASTQNFEMPTDWLRLNPTCHHKNAEPLADQFLALKTRTQPKLFYVWGHSFEFDRDSNWDLIERFAEKMAGKEEIWYAANMEIYMAVQDFSRLESSADGSLLHNPTARDVWFADIRNQTYVIRSGETVKV